MTTSPDDADAPVRAVMRRIEDAINARDFAAMAAEYAAEGDAIVGSRPRMTGRGAIRAAAETAWAAAPENRRITMRADRVRFLSPDVAIVDIAATFTAGSPTADRSTAVLVRRDDVWKVTAFRAYPAAEES